MTKVTSRLAREGRISRPLRLFGQRTYFVLTPREAVGLGEQRAIARKFDISGARERLRRSLVLRENGVQKFTPGIRGEIPRACHPRCPLGNYYIDVEKTDAGRKSRLGFMLVDYGTSPETIVKKVRKITPRGYTLVPFARPSSGGVSSSR